ncbi:hypothetical protein N431DRAFT_535465 [Stipitochalara longipes BDJ]|nr:hypothetical protein N431DRAFT_535465 [Stipitochalara longipes BDJ]
MVIQIRVSSTCAKLTAQGYIADLLPSSTLGRTLLYFVAERKQIDDSSRLCKRTKQSLKEHLFEHYMEKYGKDDIFMTSSMIHHLRISNPMREQRFHCHLSTLVAAAAALLAEIDAAAKAAIGTLFKGYSMYDKHLGGRTSSIQKRATLSTYWLANKSNLGISPYNKTSSFSVSRNFTDYGASENGVTGQDLCRCWCRLLPSPKSCKQGVKSKRLRMALRRRSRNCDVRAEAQIGRLFFYGEDGLGMIFG